MAQFISNQKTGIAKLNCELEATRETANVAIADLGNSLDQMRQRRDIDQKNSEVEVQQIRKLIRDLEAAIDGDVAVAPVAAQAQALPAAEPPSSVGSGEAESNKDTVEQGIDENDSRTR